MDYIDYLKQTQSPLFKADGIFWRVVLHKLVPASIMPTYVDISADAATQLLFESNANIIRWSNTPTETETPWWYLVCENYEQSKLSPNTKSKIRRGIKRCHVERISSAWLAKNGYECYVNAHTRYQNSKFVYGKIKSERTFHKNLLLKSRYDSIFESWGVFNSHVLVGYIECEVEKDKGVMTRVIKYDPAYLKDYSSYAMMDTLLAHYVNDNKLPVNNGERPILHVGLENFLHKFGFTRQFCKLNLHYTHHLQFFIYCLRLVQGHMPNSKLTELLKGLLRQDEIWRSCNKLLSSQIMQ